MILGNSLRGYINVCKIILLLAAAVTVMSCQQSSSSQAEAGGNRLKNEKSPYLLQHAKNPVDWYPWGDEAFDRAKKENKPIFLSIGYSTCHWCNVMEEESFMDDEVAKLMNETFVNIKVDREERPDIDSLYMTVAQVMTGSGGWPLNVVMTPDKKPFFVTTYVPKGNRFGRVGMLELIPRIRQAWEGQSKAILDSADKITGILEQLAVSMPGEALGKDGLKAAYELIAGRFDDEHGGFGDAPKFPLPHNYSYLLRYWYRTGDEKALAMAEKSLRAMRLGGIYDQIGFGFHRYSTDDGWLLPHFEKMLYDQAMHAIAYTEAFQATGRQEYANTAKEIFTYVLRDMTSPKGGFYSAEDADVDAEEGKFYFWSLEEIRKIVTKEEAELVTGLFNLEEEGNFVDPLVGRKTGENIFYLKKPLDEQANGLGMPLKDIKRRWEAARQKLFDARKKRYDLRKDDKVLTDWNGLMIAAFAKGARLFNNPAYLKAARSSADFILDEMRDSKGRLLHRYRDGEAALTASLNDYAFFVWGLIELYEASFDTRYLKTALELTRDSIKHFWDDKSGGFFFIADDAEELLVRQKDTMDGPVPAGNSVAMLNMLRLGRVLADAGLEERAAKVELLGSDRALQFPLMHTQLMIASEFAQGPSFEVVVAGRTGAADTDKMLDALDKLFVPNKVVVFRPTESESPEITKLAVFTKNQKAMNGQATVYVCVNYNCNLPTTDLNKMVELLTVRQAPKKG